MGAWATDPFGNDDAVDFLAEIGREGVLAIGGAFQAALVSDYLGAPEASRVVAAAALVAVCHGAELGLSDEVKRVAARLGHAPDDLLPVARRALGNVVSNSELEALWADGDGYDDWLAGVSRIQAALS